MNEHHQIRIECVHRPWSDSVRAAADEAHDAEFWDDGQAQRTNIIGVVAGLVAIVLGGTAAILCGVL